MIIRFLKNIYSKSLSVAIVGVSAGDNIPKGRMLVKNMQILQLISKNSSAFVK